MKLKEMIGKEVAEFGQAVGDVAGGMKALASNDGLGAISKGTDVVAYGMGKLGGTLGELAGGTLKAFVGGMALASDVVSSFVDRGRQLADLNASLSGASARDEIRSVLADVREAQELGDPLARLTDSFSEIQVLLRDAVLPIKKFIIEVLADFLEWFGQQVKEGQVLGEQAVALVKVLPEAIAATIAGRFEEVRDIINRLLGVVRADVERRQGQGQQQQETPIDAQLRQLERAMLLDQQAAPAAPRRGQVIDLLRPQDVIPQGGF